MADGSAATTAGRVGERLAVQLRRWGMSQRELADELGISAAQVSRYVSGRTPMSIDTCARIEQILNLSSGQLLADDEAVA